MVEIVKTLFLYSQHTPKYEWIQERVSRNEVLRNGTINAKG